MYTFFRTLGESKVFFLKSEILNSNIHPSDATLLTVSEGCGLWDVNPECDLSG